MIAIVYPQAYGVGGIARYLDSFLANLPQGHPRIYLITGTSQGDPKHYSGVEIIHLTSGFGRFSLLIWGWQVRRILCRLYAEKKITWVNLHWPPLIPGLFLPKHIPFVLTAHTTYLGMSGRFNNPPHFESPWSPLSLAIKSRMEHQILSRAAKVIVLTEQGAQEVHAYGYSGPLAIIPNGADPQLFSPETDPSKDIDVLFCGRIERRKGSRAMVELCRLLIALRPQIRICIVGYGDDDPWVNHVLAADHEHVRIAGKVAFSEMRHYYDRSKVYASTSYYEGLPGTCLEAMSMQLPVVVWDLLFYRGLVKEGVTGLLAAPNQLARMSSRILNLLDNPDQARKIGANGRDLLMRDYNWKRLSEEILQVFDA